MTTTQTSLATETQSATTTSEILSSSSSLLSASSGGAKLTGAGAIVGFVILGLYVLFQITVVVLILCNKLRMRRNRKGAAPSVGYSSLDSDIELGHRSKAPSSDHKDIPQLPTDEEGGEDLSGKPKLQLEGTPVYQLDDNDATWTGRISTSNLREDIQQVEGPSELPVHDGEVATKRPITKPEQSHLRRPTSSVMIDINTSTGVSRRASVVSTAHTVIIDGVKVRDV
ncbi:hypothetical protein BDV96DRAFT_17048 [Lophiotrema nucula]|uniref:Uncharacterized protein n=1 Tax=Lophiotrema nucula TaxID=690887 RepID=A0A6A5ZCS0_9PLEO|nr:hypothetical protein BDV96DRAFT_17048 [Lophiotrema nucula]